MQKLIELFFELSHINMQDKFYELEAQLLTNDIDADSFKSKVFALIQEWLKVMHEIDVLIESEQITFSRDGVDYPYELDEGVDLIIKELGK